jgi:hypothetical protein
MDMQELLDLIVIRNYVANSVASPLFDKKTIKELDGIFILLDKKIVAILMSDEFKEYVGFADVQKVIQEVRNTKEGPMNQARKIMSAISK